MQPDWHSARLCILKPLFVIVQERELYLLSFALCISQPSSKVVQQTIAFEDYFAKMLMKYLPGVEYSKQQTLFGY